MFKGYSKEETELLSLGQAITDLKTRTLENLKDIKSYMEEETDIEPVLYMDLYLNEKETKALYELLKEVIG